MLKHLAIDIVCLQERHLKKEEEKHLKQVFKGHVYHTSSGAYTKGVILGMGTREY